MDLDDEIARLEAELAEANDSSNDGSDSDDQSSTSDNNDEPDDEAIGEEALVLKSDLTDEDRIPGLSAAYLPTVAFKALAKPRVGKETREAKKLKGPKPTKEDKKSAEPVVSRAQKQAELFSYIRGYEPSEHKPFYCRICNFQGSSVEDLAAHRSSDDHKAATDRDQKACLCKLCRKQFTSPAQLTEHLKGKSHKDMLLKRSDPDAYKAQRQAEDTAEKALRETKWAAKRMASEEDAAELPSQRSKRRCSAIDDNLGPKEQEKPAEVFEPATSKSIKTEHNSGSAKFSEAKKMRTTGFGNGSRAAKIVPMDKQRAQQKTMVDKNALRLLAMVRSGNKKK
jgi:hypothetical protein